MHARHSVPTVMRRASFIILTVLSLGVAGYAWIAYGFGQLGDRVHPDMRPAFEANPFAIRTHIFASSLALLLGPFQFSTRLRARNPELHRWMGRAYLGLGVLVGGGAGLYMSLHAYGGVAGKLGFGSLALAWLYTGARAFNSARNRAFEAHRRWMIRNFALSFAAVTLRLYVPSAFALRIPHEAAYPFIAWACWLPNLALAEWIARTTRHPLLDRNASSAPQRAPG